MKLIELKEHLTKYGFVTDPDVKVNVETGRSVTNFHHDDEIILALLEDRARHGYEIGKLIEARSDGRLAFRIPSLYPVLCRLEERGLIAGRWVEKAGEHRRRFYRLTPEGRAAAMKALGLREGAQIYEEGGEAPWKA